MLIKIKKIGDFNNDTKQKNVSKILMIAQTAGLMKLLGSMFLIQKSLKQYQFIVMLSTMIYQQNSRVLYMFVAKKYFGKLLDISPKNVILLKTFNSEFSYI